MGRVARLISFVRATTGTAKTSDVTVDRGGADNRTPQHFSDPGDDSFPLPDDYTHLEGQAGTGRDSVLGYVDPKNEQKATAGDKRIYARDSATGDQVVEVWLKSDGSVRCSNASGSFELKDNGDFVVNGVTISANGGVNMPNSLVLNGKEIDGHDHAINSGSSAPGPTGPNK